MSTLILLQSLFYLVGGLWPIIHYRSFEKVTGPKKEPWFVITMGWLITVSGVVFLLSYINDRVPVEVVTLAIGEAFVLAGIDLYYVAKKVIAPVYLFDALLEIILIVTWFILLSFQDSNYVI